MCLNAWPVSTIRTAGQFDVAPTQMKVVEITSVSQLGIVDRTEPAEAVEVLCRPEAVGWSVACPGPRWCDLSATLAEQSMS